MKSLRVNQLSIPKVCDGCTRTIGMSLFRNGSGTFKYVPYCIAALMRLFQSSGLEITAYTCGKGTGPAKIEFEDGRIIIITNPHLELDR